MGIWNLGAGFENGTGFEGRSSMMDSSSEMPRGVNATLYMRMEFTS
ncbi:MAG: hypothetical protein R3F19_18440 [Verrucomicrobiales bacterium]